MTCYGKGIFIIPEFQRLTNQKKIDEMTKTFNRDKDFINYLLNPL